VSNNLTIESPNFEKISKEAGQFTSDAISTLWSALNDTRKTERIDFRLARDIMAPKVLPLAASASVDNLDLAGCSVIQFTGSTAQNFTGMRAPETGITRIVLIHNTGSGTITAKHNATSDTANRLSNSTAADVALATGASRLYIYLSSLWRDVTL
jgi:hypothetical protein